MPNYLIGTPETSLVAVACLKLTVEQLLHRLASGQLSKIGSARRSKAGLLDSQSSNCSIHYEACGYEGRRIKK